MDSEFRGPRELEETQIFGMDPDYKYILTTVEMYLEDASPYRHPSPHRKHVGA
jgi:hypothetical protein